jgi:hypothetical protein
MFGFVFGFIFGWLIPAPKWFTSLMEAIKSKMSKVDQ